MTEVLLDDTGRKARGVRYLDRAPSFREEFMAVFSGEESESVPTDAFAALSPAPDRLLATALADLQRIMAGPAIQVRCLECPVELSAVPPSEPSGWKAMLLSLFG